MNEEIMVKVCSKCGIVNSERAKKCEECGTKLGAAVKNSDAEELIEQITKRNEEIKESITAAKYGGSIEKTPHIPITPSRIVIGVIALLVSVGLIVLMVLSCISPNEFTKDLIAADFCGLLLLAYAMLHCFAPSAMWAFSHLTYQLHYKEMPEPSDTALVLQQVACVLLILFGAAVFGFHFAVFFGLF